MMTMIITILVGAGALLIISAIENVSMVETFQSIISGKPATTPSSFNQGTSNSGGPTAL